MEGQMTVYTFDDSNATTPQDRLKPGWYNVEVGQVDDKIAKTGVPMLTLGLVIIDGEHEGREVNYADNIMLGGKGAGIGKKKLKAFGIDISGGEEFDPATLRGRRAQAYLHYEEYKGQDNLRVKLNAGSCGYSPLATNEGFEAIPFALLIALPLLGMLL